MHDPLKWNRFEHFSFFTFQELHSNYNTECKFTVYDADGLVDNALRMEIEDGDYNESSHFEFRNPVDIDGYTREYTLL